MKRSCCIVVVTLFVVLNAFGGYHDIRVVAFDEDNKPVPGLLVETCGWTGLARIFSKGIRSGKTDKNGVVRLRGAADSNVYGWVRPGEGFYGSSFVCPSGESVVTSHVKKVGSPIGLAYLAKSLKVPDGCQNVGFDVLKADWMPPYGLGEVADAIVSVQIDKVFEGKSKCPSVSMKIDLVSRDSGIARLKIDECCSYAYVTNAKKCDLSGRLIVLTNSRCRDGGLRSFGGVLGKDYCVIRLNRRSVEGTTVSYYGLIEELVFTVHPDMNGLALRIASLFNPVPDDANIERNRDVRLQFEDIQRGWVADEDAEKVCVVK